jgi:hypothetical protein
MMLLALRLLTWLVDAHSVVAFSYLMNTKASGVEVAQADRHLLDLDLLLGVVSQDSFNTESTDRVRQ